MSGDETKAEMQIGAYSFGDTQRNADGSLRSSAGAIRNLFDAIVHADTVGLDYFGVGEHHTPEMPASSSGTVIAAAAAATRQITLGSAVSVLSTDDPVRVFQQFATADAIAPGRIEITAGRGSSTESFPLFGYDLADYDRLYAEKLELLLAINASERVSWSGTVRPALNDAVVVPRPASGSLPIWIGTGGSPQSSARAGSLGLPVAYGVIGGSPARFAPLADLYRRAAVQAGRSGPDIKVSVAALGFVAPTTREAKERWYPGWRTAFEEIGRIRGFSPPSRAQFDVLAQGEGAYFVGSPDEIAARIVELHSHLGHMRHFLQMDLGGLPQEYLLESITLLATEVKPRITRLLAKK